VPSKTPQRILVVEDNPTLLRCLVTALSRRAANVVACATVAEAKVAMAELRPDLVVLDVMLPDGDAFDVLDAAHALDAFPVIVAMSGAAGPDQSFRLAQRGVRAFLPKPLDLDTIDRVLDEALASGPDIVPIVRAAVGHAPVREVEAVVRRTMVNEALGRTRGSKNGAAKILRVSRQLLQHMVRATAG
jgi:DNA-binding NtrC family response regulator